MCVCVCVCVCVCARLIILYTYIEYFRSMLLMGWREVSKTIAVE